MGRDIIMPGPGDGCRIAKAVIELDGCYVAEGHYDEVVAPGVVSLRMQVWGTYLRFDAASPCFLRLEFRSNDEVEILRARLAKAEEMLRNA
jgi:hypothetical protein